MKSLHLQAYAKINLGLAILGRRRDGFHELRTIFQSISLADRLEVSLATGRRSVTLEASGFPVPAGGQNLAARAALTLLDELHLQRRVSIRLEKRIPPSSGLGGASSDAAAVLRGLLVLSRKTIPADRLLHLAASLGSDVPFFLFGGRALGIGRGEEIYPLPEGPRQYCVVVFPRHGMPTAEAYRKLRRPLLTTSTMRPTIERFCGKVNEAALNPFGNDFEAVVFSAFPELAAVKASLLRSGAEMASVTGSGSAVFGILRTPGQARELAREFRQPGRFICVAHTVSRREFLGQFQR